MPAKLSTRREFIALAASGSVLPLAGCAGGEEDSYIESNQRLRAVLSENPEIKDLVRYATLAANGHNSQPWLFFLGRNRVSILPDFSRRTPAVDPDDHHLFVSLGCAAENLMIAGAAHGQPGSLFFDAAAPGRIDIDLAADSPAVNDLYHAIPKRQSTRSAYDGTSVSLSDMRKLEAAALVEGVNTRFITDRQQMEQLLDYVIAGNSLQVDDPDFVAELKHSIRFNASEAVETGDGLYTASSGNPTMPGWLGRTLFGLFYTKDAENDKYAAQVRTSAGIAVFTGDDESEASWVSVGRSFQRFALQATALGIRHSHINQPVEVAAVRKDFARWLGAGGKRPDLVVRFGYAPPLPMSLRRPVEAVLNSDA